ncbi:MAG: FAD-binding oxidoreductase, partial [Planctomycetaceae bacterium]|nr:FAD-binding oxidoreductase [Planctomycetaceae bacterium]
MPQQRVVILGAGIQGVSLAFALAARGLHVQILDAESKPLKATSVRNEGKIHLGFVYALDETGATQRAMMQSALCFSSLLDQWCGKLPWHEWRADNFYYAVMPESLAGVDQLAQSYECLRQLLKDYSRDDHGEPNYLGQPLSWLWKREKDVSRALFACGQFLQGLFRTEETAIDTRLLARSLRKRLMNHSRID